MSQINKNFSEMTSTEKWQHFLRRKYQELENSYYPLVDELTEKLADLDGINSKDIPDLTIHQFSFIKEWQNGDISSASVLAILKSLDPEKVAVTQLTRRLTNFMHGRERTGVRDYIIPCRAIILDKSVPLYTKYLEMLIRYFMKLVEIDNAQEKITWIEQLTHPDNSIQRRIADYSLNQVIRQLDAQVIPFNQTKYIVGDNIICLDEDMAKGAFAVHWLFAPKSYIDFLKKEFKIKDEMDIKTEAAYIKNLIGAYVHEKV